MHMMGMRKVLVCCAAAALIAAMAGGMARGAVREVIVTAYTAPTVENRSELAFRQNGIVKQVLVKEGQKVKKGDLLIQLDDSIEVATWQSLEIQAKSTLQEQAATIEFNEKSLEYQRQENLTKTHAGSQLELDRAKLEMDTAQKKIQIAHEEQQYKTYDASARLAQVEQMKIKAPFDGEIEKITIHVGELASTDQNKPVITVVQSDPLNVVMDLPNSQADKLQTGDAMQVRYGEKQPWMEAQVSFISPAADAKSFTRKVKLVMSNPNGIAPGHEVQVKLPEKATVDETASLK